MTMGIVAGFEFIHINGENREPPTMTLGLGQGKLQTLFKAQSIGQMSQWVLKGELPPCFVRLVTRIQQINAGFIQLELRVSKFTPDIC
ncbi:MULTISPECIES: hypothetical protein [unclassified Cyanobium]|uniref:hypothetical protein n=1 Tax=unclassified Cyanobium TaxID=2627006 RepID=UPI0020CE82EC|nr:MULTISPECIES: hypothetical protein [unclassified Cyanobium]